MQGDLLWMHSSPGSPSTQRLLELAARKGLTQVQLAEERTPGVWTVQGVGKVDDGDFPFVW